jgi:hypothetical protein
MGVEFSTDVEPQIDFPEPTEIATSHSQTEEAQVRSAVPSSAQDSARKADRDWVEHMDLLGRMSGEAGAGILALSDGFTSHMVTLSSVAKGADDYWVTYVDPWPPERGSFLEEGKNVAGCTATCLQEQVWIIRAEELFRVLDSAIVITPRKDDDGQTKDNSSSSQ